MDSKGIGRPHVFTAEEDKFRVWASELESFIDGAYGEDFRQVLEWVNEQDAPIDKGQWTDAFEVEPIDEPDDKISQMH